MTLYDPDTSLTVLKKQPWENRLYTIPFSQELRTGDTVASVTSVTATGMGLVTGALALTIASAPASDDGNVQPRISAGTSGEHYKVTARVVTTNGDNLEVDVMLYVED